jgi:hypothetical protein
MVTLRRQNAPGIILGTATMARAGFADLFKDQPEEQKAPGYFTRGVYTASPMILDSANADMLAFAERYPAVMAGNRHGGPRRPMMPPDLLPLASALPSPTAPLRQIFGPAVKLYAPIYPHRTARQPPCLA